MGFKDNLKDELIYNDMQTKELAAKTGISLNTLNHYLVQNGTSPSAENAVKIARALGVSVEYLVTGREPPKKKTFSSAAIDTKLCKKYYLVIQKLDAMPAFTRNLLCKLITEWKE